MKIRDMSRCRTAFRLGVVDGWREPHCLSSGMTWDDDQDKNEAYDTGANVGQFLRSPLRNQARMDRIGH